MRQGKIWVSLWKCNSSPGCDEGLGWFWGVCYVFLPVELLLKRETIFILTSFHIPVPNNTHSDSISFFFFLPGSTCQPLSRCCSYSCLFNPQVPFFIHYCQTPWAGRWGPKKTSSLKHIHSLVIRNTTAPNKRKLSLATRSRLNPIAIN